MPWGGCAPGFYRSCAIICSWSKLMLSYGCEVLRYMPSWCCCMRSYWELCVWFRNDCAEEPAPVCEFDRWLPLEDGMGCCWNCGWAGGGAGPDFFVYLGKYPADWLGHDHTVFGVLEDEASLAVAEKIVAMDSHTPGGPNTMRFLREKMTFDVVAADV